MAVIEALTAAVAPLREGPPAWAGLSDREDRNL